MKLKVWILFFFLALALFFSVSAFAASWQAYGMPDGSICVTDEALEQKSISELTLGLNETRFIDVRSSAEHRFVSSSRYVSVDEEGMLLCEGTGRATLRVYYTVNSYLEIKITVEKAPTSIKLDKTSLTLNPEQTAKLKYTLSRGSAGWVSFYSADQDVVTVTEKGEIYALAPGKTKVIVETYNGKSAECAITVQAPPAAQIEIAKNFDGYAYEYFDLNAKLSGGFNEVLSYLSLNPDICEVDASGRVYCLKEGIALLELSASGGNKVSCMIRVLPPATAIRAVNEKLYLYEGGIAQLSAVTTGGGGTFYAESLDPELAVIENENTVRALKPGLCRIRLFVYELVSCEVELRILPFPKECILYTPSQTLAVGETSYFSVASEYTASMPFTLESSDPNVLRVYSDGTLYAQARGVASIRAASGGTRQEVVIEVVPMARSIAFSENSGTIGVGDSLQLHLTYKDGAGTAIYSSSNEQIARVDESGTVYAVSPGNVNVSAKLLNNAFASVTITVMPETMNLYLQYDDITIGCGDAIKLDFRYDEGSYSLIHYQSDDEAIVAVSPDGTVKSVGPTGGAYVTASTASGASKRVYFIVAQAPSSFTIDSEPLSQKSLFTDYISMDTGSQLDLNVRFEGYTFVTYRCISHDEEIATVSEEGLITALKQGTARITVSAYNGATREILLEVK